MNGDLVAFKQPIKQPIKTVLQVITGAEEDQ